MNWSAASGRIVRFVLFLVLGLAAYGVLRGIGIHDLTKHDAEGVSALLQLVGSIYAVLLAFAIFVIWGQFTEVENLVTRECGALDDLLRFSEHLNPDDAASVR